MGNGESRRLSVTPGHTPRKKSVAPDSFEEVTFNFMTRHFFAI